MRSSSIRRSLLFAAALTLGTGLLFGLFPALHSTRPDLLPTLKGQAGQPGGGRAAKRFRTTLATVQIAMSMALLVSAGLFTKSLMNVSRVDLGLKIDDLVTFRVSPELNGYAHERSQVFFNRLEDELARLPGVTGVTASLVPVLGGSNWGNGVARRGLPDGAGHRHQRALQRGRRRLLPDDGHPADGRPRVHDRGHRSARPRSRSSTRRS